MLIREFQSLALGVLALFSIFHSYRWTRNRSGSPSVPAASFGAFIPVAEPEGHFTATGAGILSFGVCVGLWEMGFAFLHDFHHIRGRTPGTHKSNEYFVRFVDPMEKTFPTGTEIIEPVFTTGGLGEAFLQE